MVTPGRHRLREIAGAGRVLIAAVAAALLVSCGGASPSAPTPTPTPPPTPPPKPKVLIITVDGLRADAVAKASAPNIRILAGRGSCTYQAQTTFPPHTLPSHASLISGYPPSVHGMTWDDYRPEKGTIKTPTVFSIAHNAGRRTVMIVGKQKLAHLNAPGTIDVFCLESGGDKSVADRAIIEMAVGFDLMLAQFPDVDLTGHTSGWMSAPYLQKIAQADTVIGTVLAVLPPFTTVILTADHGGNGTNHGKNIPEDMTIPWIAAGPTVNESCTLATRVNTMDTAATALHVLGLSLQPEASGRVVTEAFRTASPGASRGRVPILLAPQPAYY